VPNFDHTGDWARVMAPVVNLVYLSKLNLVGAGKKHSTKKSAGSKPPYKCTTPSSRHSPAQHEHEFSSDKATDCETLGRSVMDGSVAAP